MKTVFDKPTRDELVSRINMLNETSTAQWGKMNAYQMVKHCRLWEEWMQSTRKNKQAFIGILFGKIGLKKFLADERPLPRNTPTLPKLIITENAGDISLETAKWAALIEAYEHFTNTEFVHPFFGKMTREQIGQLAYKHTDHHLRQFNC